MTEKSKLEQLQIVSKTTHSFFIKDHGISDIETEELVNTAL